MKVMVLGQRASVTMSGKILFYLCVRGITTGATSSCKNCLPFRSTRIHPRFLQNEPIISLFLLKSLFFSSIKVKLNSPCFLFKVESGIKHHKPNSPYLKFLLSCKQYSFFLSRLLIELNVFTHIVIRLPEDLVQNAYTSILDSSKEDV